MRIADGYFAVSEQFPEPEGPESASRLANLNLACYESRGAVIQSNYRVLRIYRGPWEAGVEVRLVRFNPEIDVLLPTGVLDMAVMHPHSGRLSETRTGDTLGTLAALSHSATQLRLRSM